MGKKRNGESKICVICEKEFYVPCYRIATAKFCSLDCQNHRQYERYVFKCKSCGIECSDSLSRKYQNKKYCSIECRDVTRQSERERRQKSNAHNVKVRGFNSSRLLRRYVWEFKNKKCEVCGYDEYDFCLDIHHIDKDPKNNKLENLIVLCVICHRKHHKGIINATQERLKQI